MVDIVEAQKKMNNILKVEGGPGVAEAGSNVEGNRKNDEISIGVF